MANNTVRISIPTNPADRLTLGASIYAKHLADGDASPLKSIISNSWESNGPKVATGLEHHKQAEVLKDQSDLAYRKRDLDLSEVDESIKASRDVLLGIYRDNPKELLQWGFSVSDSPRAAKKDANTTK
jgi:hypothetical protein